MQDIFGSVRRSLVFRPPDGNGEETLVDKINTCIRKSKVFSRASPALIVKENALTPSIRWRKGELIGCGAFGHVYMGMNLDSGELLAVKQVLIAANSASKEKAKAHIKELEEEVKLLKNLSHANIVRYLGTVREEDTLNILLEFVPGGSISSLLGKFGSFPEAVIRMYTKQLLLGLDYLHKNGIMHRDIKGANILVDNKGCIKLADFGASKQVVELANLSGAKSMKGTPYWMAPEVILQTGHSFSADIWSVGCTVIEMATGKPPWSQQYQEVAALFHVGTTKSHPPIPDHLSIEAKDFLQKCLQKEPELRPSACELLQHSFVAGKSMESHETDLISTEKVQATEDSQGSIGSEKLKGTPQHGWEENVSDDDMCQIDDKDDFKVGEEAEVRTVMASDDFNKRFNPIREPSDDWTCKYDETHEREQIHTNMEIDQDQGVTSLSEDDDEVTESRIIAFLDEKAVELKKLQTPLYEEFYNNSLTTICPSSLDAKCEEGGRNFLKLPPKSRSPNKIPSSAADGVVSNTSPVSSNKCMSNVTVASPLSPQDESNSPSSASFAEIQRKWKEELDQELERKREMMRQVGVTGKTSSPKDRGLNRQRDKSRFASPGK